MIMLSKKSWVFVFLAVFLLLLTVFYSKSGFNVKFVENFIKVKFFSASLSGAPEELSAIEKLDLFDNLPAIQEPQKQVLAEEPVAHQLTQEKIQEELDDIAEKLDIIQWQVDELVAQSKADEPQKEDEDKTIDEKDKIEEQEKLQENIIDEAKPVFAKILISEVQVAGPSDEKQEFVELYNPNSNDVDLTGWYLQRKTKNSQDYLTFASNKLFLGKKIFANGHFLICREGYNFNGLCDIFTENPLTESNSLVLKNPNREISDEFLTIAPSVAIVGGGGGGGGSAPIVYPKILISEVQVASQTDEKQEFVELYNPNNADVNLTNWYLQRKTSGSSNWSTYASKTLFSEKIITANSYFLIARTGYFAELADISTDNAITDSNSFAFKDPSGEISDKLGFGSASDFELLATVSPSLGQSIGRKVLTDGIEQDTDNNSTDFELNEPTPKSQNIIYIEPPATELLSIAIIIPANKLIYNIGDILDISGLVVTGTYSDGSIIFETITLDNVTGFDSSVFAEGQILTITVNGQTIIYTIDVNETEDTTPPTGTIIINNGAEYTNNRNVFLTISATDDLSEVVEIKIANSSFYHDWEPYTTSKDWVLPATNGVKTVRIKFKDSAGNETAVGIPDTIILDTTSVDSGDYFPDSGDYF